MEAEPASLPPASVPLEPTLPDVLPSPAGDALRRADRIVCALSESKAVLTEKNKLLVARIAELEAIRVDQPDASDGVTGHSDWAAVSVGGMI